MEIPDHFTCLLRDKKHQLELNMEQQTCSKLGEEYVKAIYYHSAYLTYLATSCEMPGWETMETVKDFIVWAPASLQMVTAVMKLKDACSLEGKL